jgi:ribonucleoside-diphosphate reductase alpha chain
MPVSCTGNYIPDSIRGFFSATKEIAQLTKEGKGTSSDLSGVRPRGSLVANGLKAEGIMPVVKLINQTVSMVSQGKNRSGAWAGYLTFEHGDFEEYIQHLTHNPKENAGFTLTDAFYAKLKQNDAEAMRRIKLWAKLRCDKGIGYLLKRDAVMRMWAKQGRPDTFRASNLCTEILLPSGPDLSYVCVLLSLNLANWDAMAANPSLIEDAFIVLNAINELFIDLATQAGWDNDKELIRTLRFAREYRALGLGVMGYHTYLQKQGIPFHEQSAVNKSIFHRIQQVGLKVSRALAVTTGKVACRDQYNWALCAIAPTLSTSLIMGGVSMGIEPVFSNAYTQEVAGGIVARVNPNLLDLLKAKGKASKAVIDSIHYNKGSVQGLDFLSEREKQVYRTGFEIDQHQIVRFAAERQQFIDQGQSVNTFKCGDQAYQTSVHTYALRNPSLYSLYYLRQSEEDIPTPVCDSCEG